MGVSDEHLKQNEANARLVKGSKKLGYHVDAIPVSIFSFVGSPVTKLILNVPCQT